MSAPSSLASSLSVPRAIGRTVGAAAVLTCLTLSACSSGSPSGAGPEADDRVPESSPTVLASTEPEADAPAPRPGKDLPDDLIEVARTEREAWVTGAKAFLVQVETALAEPKSSTPLVDLEQVSGPALEALTNTVTEFEVNGWQVKGKAKIVSEQVVRRTQDPEAVVMRVCVDNSDVRVVDAQGKVVPNSRATSPRTLNVIALVAQDGRWVVTEQRTAPQPDC